VNILEVIWNFEPRVVPSWPMPVWYGLLWAVSFLIGFKILEKMFKSEDVPAEWMDKILVYVLLGGVIGARLGHVFFYEPKEYLADPISILKIWEGGLASHGGALGVIIAAYLFSKRVSKKPVLWILDRLVVPTALAGFFIRIGNLFNHEIVGKATNTDYGFKFLRHEIPGWQAKEITNTDNLHDAFNEIATNPAYADLINSLPNRHPSQLYEAIAYLFIFFLILFLFWRTNASKLKGFLLGVFFILLFGARFLIEFTKESQGGADTGGLLFGFNMGQLLSIPLVLIGVYLLVKNIGQLKLKSNSLE
jgi:phosphatidylglycerol:prolipoprotein diacylglycerol transferase